MSYSRRPQQKSPRFVPVEGTLFDEAFLDDVAAEAGSREAAYAELGLQAPEVPVEPKADIIRRSLAERAVKAVRSEIDPVISEAGNASIEETDLDRVTSMKALFEHDGFYPRDVAEKSSMLAILGRSTESVRPVIVYLANVGQHQKKYEVEDRFAAARSIGRKMEERALQADDEAKKAREMYDVITKRGARPEQSFSEVFTLDDIKYDDFAKPIYTSIVRRIESELFVEDGIGEYPLGLHSGVDSLKLNDRDEYVYDVLKTMSLGSVRGYTERVRVEENRRFEYWRTQLEHAQLWMPLQSQASESLKKLDAKRPRATSKT